MDPKGKGVATRNDDYDALEEKLARVMPDWEGESEDESEEEGEEGEEGESEEEGEGEEEATTSDAADEQHSPLRMPTFRQTRVVSGADAEQKRTLRKDLVMRMFESGELETLRLGRIEKARAELGPELEAMKLYVRTMRIAVASIPDEIRAEFSKPADASSPPPLLPRLPLLLHLLNEHNKQVDLPRHTLSDPLFTFLVQQKATWAVDALLRSHILRGAFDPSKHPAFQRASDLPEEKILEEEELVEIERRMDSGDGEEEDEDASGGGGGDKGVEDSPRGRTRSPISRTTTSTTPSPASPANSPSLQSQEPMPESSSSSSPTSSQESLVVRYYARVAGDAASNPLTVGDYETMLEELETDIPRTYLAVAAKKEFLRVLTEEGMIDTGSKFFDMYMGACIADTVLGRNTADYAKSSAPSSESPNTTFLHRLRYLQKQPFVSYEWTELAHVVPKTSSTSHAGPLTPTQLWKSNPVSGLVERLLIGAVWGSAWNSALGGFCVSVYDVPPNIAQIAQEIENHLVEAPEHIPLSPSAQTSFLNQIDNHFAEAREVHRALKDKPITFSSLKKVTAAASAVKRTLDGDTVTCVTGKDIPLADALDEASVYGDVAGGAAQRYRGVVELVYGLVVWGMALFCRVMALGEIAVRETYKPFVDIWCVCILHRNVVIAIILLVRYYWLVKPRCTLVWSDKVSNMAASRQLVLPEHHLLADLMEVSATSKVVRQLASVLSTIVTAWKLPKKWKKMGRGGLILGLAGTIRVIAYGFGLSIRYMIMSTDIHPGFDAYNPHLAYRLFSFHVLVLLQHRIIETLSAREVGPWSEEVANRVAEEARGIAERLGITDLLEEYRHHIQRVNHALMSLSNARPYKDGQSFEETYERMSAARQVGVQAAIGDGIVAGGKPHSTARKSQWDAWVKSGDPVPLPKAMGWELHSPDHARWFMDLKQNTHVSRSARTTLPVTAATLKHMSAMREALVDERGDYKMFPNYKSTVSLIDIFDMLISLRYVHHVRTQRTDPVDGINRDGGWRIVHCNRCAGDAAYGIVTSHDAGHFCGGTANEVVIGEGAVGNPGNHLLIQRLLYPIQLLGHELFGPLLIAHVDANADKYLGDPIPAHPSHPPLSFGVAAIGLKSEAQDPAFESWMNEQVNLAIRIRNESAGRHPSAFVLQQHPHNQPKDQESLLKKCYLNTLQVVSASVAGQASVLGSGVP